MIKKSSKIFLYEKWWVKNLLFPIFVGLTIGLGVIIITKLFDKPKYNIKTTICAPLTNIKVELVNETTGKKYPIKNSDSISPISVIFENTGTEPLKNLDIFIELKPKNNKLIFYDEYFASKPEKGFGKVNISTESAIIKKLNLELFNPSDKFYYYATVNSPVITEVYLKTPGISYSVEKSPGCN